jgi:hypothetical protein
MTVPQFIPELTSVSRRAEGLILDQASGSPLVIPISLLERILEQVNEGIGSVPRGGAEVGGLLVGAKGGGVVEEILPIPTEYRFGPSFRLSADDVSSAQELIRGVPQPKTIFGFYRSRTRGQTGLRETDREFLRLVEQTQKSCAINLGHVILFEAASMFVFTAAVSARKGDGDFSEWRNYTLKAPAGGSVTVSDEAPQAPAPPIAESVLVEPSPAVSVPAPALPVDTPAAHTTEPASGSKFGWQAAVAGILALAGAGGAFYYVAKGRATAPNAAVATVAPTPNGAHTNFSASPQNGMWKLTWNGDAVSAMHPTRAVLSIRDAGNQKQLVLSPADLATGMAFYGAQSADLVFSLEIDRAGLPSLEEHVNVLSATKQ